MCTTSFYTQNFFRLAQFSLTFGKILAEREIISLLNIDSLQAFITETECVYCAVRIESLNTIHHSSKTSYSSSQMDKPRVHKQSNPFVYVGER
jgi:hypothetical protein